MGDTNGVHSMTRHELREDLIGQLNERVQKQAEKLADLGEKLVERDRQVKQLSAALGTMLKDYQKGSFNILTIENAHVALTKAEI